MATSRRADLGTVVVKLGTDRGDSEGAGDGTAAPQRWYSYFFCLSPSAFLAADCGPREVLAVSATPLPAGETRTYPCISWCSAEQKSVQYIG